jgi:hypothetical protein
MLTLEIAINEKHGGAAHSRSVDEEMDKICNHKFV